MSEYSENDKIREERCDCCERCEENEDRVLLKDALVILAAAVVVLGGLHYVRGILGPILLATFFAAMLSSPMRWLQSKGWSQTFSLTIVILFVLAIGSGTITVVGAQLKQFAGDVPKYRDRFNEELARYNIELGDFVPFLKENKEDENEQNNKQGENDDALADRRSSEDERWILDQIDRAWKEKTKEQRADEKSEEETEPGKITLNLKQRVAPIAQTAYQTPAPETEASDAPLVLGSAEETFFFPPPMMALGGEDSATSEGEMAGTLDAKGMGEESGFLEENAATASENEEEYVEETPVDTMGAPAPMTSVQAASNELFGYLSKLTSELSSLASNSFITTLLVVFMLCEMTSMPKKMAVALGKTSFVNGHIQKVVADIRNYMVIKTWMSLGVGTCVTLLLMLTDVQYPLLWGFVAFLLNYIPNIGSVVAAVPPIVLATVDHGCMIGGIVAIFLVIINCTIGYVIEPRLLGNGLDLSPLFILIALILFGWLLGPVGMFLSPPLAVISKIIFQSFPETRWIAVLMANRPPRTDGDLEEDGAKAGA